MEPDEPITITIASSHPYTHFPCQEFEQGLVSLDEYQRAYDAAASDLHELRVQKKLRDLAAEHVTIRESLPRSTPEMRRQLARKLGK